MTTKIWLENDAVYVIEDCRVQVGDVVKTDDGNWRVLRIEHQIAPRHRRSALEVMRDAIGEAEDDRRRGQGVDQAPPAAMRAFTIFHPTGPQGSASGQPALLVERGLMDGGGPYEGGV